MSAAAVARSGAESAKPALQELYRTRAAAYQEAVQAFVQGYREGFAGLPEENDEAATSAATSAGKLDEARKGTPPAGTSGRAGAPAASQSLPKTSNGEVRGR